MKRSDLLAVCRSHDAPKRPAAGTARSTHAQGNYCTLYSIIVCHFPVLSPQTVSVLILLLPPDHCIVIASRLCNHYTILRQTLRVHRPMKQTIKATKDLAAEPFWPFASAPTTASNCDHLLIGQSTCRLPHCEEIVDAKRCSLESKPK